MSYGLRVMACMEVNVASGRITPLPSSAALLVPASEAKYRRAAEDCPFPGDRQPLMTRAAPDRPPRSVSHLRPRISNGI